jgi:hypothetical protein
VDIHNQSRALALVSMYSAPHPELLNKSQNTLISVTHSGNPSLKVVDIRSIESVVAVIPHTLFQDGSSRFFVVEKPGLELVHMSGFDKDMVN